MVIYIYELMKSGRERTGYERGRKGGNERNKGENEKMGEFLITKLYSISE